MGLRRAKTCLIFIRSIRSSGQFVALIHMQRMERIDVQGVEFCRDTKYKGFLEIALA